MKFIFSYFFILFHFFINGQIDVYAEDILHIEDNTIFYVDGNLENNNESFENNGEFSLTGDLTNRAEITNPGIGSLKLIGTQRQQFNLVENFKTYNLEIDNGQDVYFIGKRNMEIFGDLDFIEGRFFTNSKSLINLKPGSIYFYASDQSHIDGPVIKEGNTQFTFPIGKLGRLRPLRISSVSDLHSFRAEYFNAPYNDLSTDQTLNNVSDWEYWNLEKLQGTSNPTLTLNWDEQSFVQYKKNELSIARFNQFNWTEVKSSTELPEQLNTDITSIENLSFYGDFTFSSKLSTSLLRDGVSDFQIFKSNCDVEISWNTIERSKRIEKYVVERKSNFEPFSSIAIVYPENNKLIDEYLFMDKETVQNTIYHYRITTHYSDGSESYTEAKFLKAFCGELSAILYPNPISVNDEITIQINSNIKKETYLVIVDILGQILLRRDLNIEVGTNEIKFGTERLGESEYFIWMPEEDDVPTLEFQVIR